MIKVIGKKNCSSCAMVKTLLTNNKIEYTYELLEDLDETSQQQYMDMAIEKGVMSMPLIIKDGELISIKEVIV